MSELKTKANQAIAAARDVAEGSCTEYSIETYFSLWDMVMEYGIQSEEEMLEDLEHDLEWSSLESGDSVWPLLRRSTQRFERLITRKREDERAAELLHVYRQKYPDLDWDFLEGKSLVAVEGICYTDPNLSDEENRDALSLRFQVQKWIEDEDYLDEELLDLVMRDNYPVYRDLREGKLDHWIVGRVGKTYATEPENYLGEMHHYDPRRLSVRESREETIERNQKYLDEWAYHRLFAMEINLTKRRGWSTLGLWIKPILLPIARLYQRYKGLSAGKADSPEARRTRDILKQGWENSQDYREGKVKW